MSKFFVEIITPERVFYRGEVDLLSLPTIDGRASVMATNEPFVFALQPGTLVLREGENVREAFISDGFAEVRSDETIVLSQAAEWPEEIDENKAREAKERAEEMLRHSNSLKEYKLSKAALSRAFARLRIKSNHDIH